MTSGAKVVRLHVSTGSALLAAMLVLAAACTQPEPRRWNVLMIVADTVRGDHLSVNGYERDTTPHLDALAAEGVNFSQAFTAAPRTWQSFTTILTGLYPPHHGVRFIGDYGLSDDVPTLGSLLGAAGYETHGFDQVRWLRQMTGDHGFGDYTERLVSQKDLLETVWKWLSERAEGSATGETREKPPFFAFVKIIGTHWPYDEGDAEDLAQFDSCDDIDHSFNRSLGGLQNGEAGEGFLLVRRRAYKIQHYRATRNERQRLHMVAHYDAELHYLDRLIGKLIDRMRGGGLLDRTIVVVTSDHGEALGEHGHYQHGPVLDESVVRVPLIIRFPEKHPAALRGVTVADVVRTVDIVPTVLAAVSVTTDARFDGVNLVPSITGKSDPGRWAYAESGRSFVGGDPDRYIAGVEGKMRMIRDRRWKLIFIPHPQEAVVRLFDLEADPGEMNDVAGENPEVVERMKGRLEPFLVARPGSRPERSPNEAEKEQLRQLGYM